MEESKYTIYRLFKGDSDADEFLTEYNKKKIEKERWSEEVLGLNSSTDKYKSEVPFSVFDL